MTTTRIVVIGASAGGIETLRMLVSGLPANFPAAICIVLHTSPQSPGVLPGILARAGHLPAVNARDTEPLRPGHIYVAPPDHHLVLEPGRVRVTKGPRENRFRPAIDPLFRSAAQVYGPAGIGVVLTGNLDDGTAGLWAIKRLGGTAIVQDPDDALFPSMPLSAVNHVEVDHVVPLADIAPLLVRLTATSRTDEGALTVPDEMDVEIRIAKEENPIEAGLEQIAQPSRFACPECHGVLLKVVDGGRVRFRCHTGHAYSAESLLADIEEATHDALWNAIRALEESGMLMQHMASHLDSDAHVRRAGHDADVARLRRRAEEAHQQAEAVRALTSGRTPAAPAEG